MNLNPEDPIRVLCFENQIKEAYGAKIAKAVVISSNPPVGVNPHFGYFH
jgi:hypothetical protein